MATSTYGTPYVQGSDLVSAYPTVSSSLATRVDEVSYRGNGLNAQTGTTYTLVVGDAGKTITLSNASAVAVTLPQDSVATLPSGAVVSFYNLGAGTVTISQGTGATLQGGAITLAQYAVTTVIKLSANTYGRFDGGENTGLAASPPTSIANSGGTASLAANTVTYSGVSSISLNGCFTATYDNYRIVCRSSCGAAVNGSIRLRASGIDATTNYNYQRLQADGTTVSGSNYASQNAWEPLSWAVNEQSLLTVDIARPFIAASTNITTHQTQYNFMRLTGGTHTTATAYDGITFFPNSNTISGTVSVYGYRN